MVKMRSLLFLPYTTKFVRAKPQNLLKHNHTNVRAHNKTFGGHPKKEHLNVAKVRRRCSFLNFSLELRTKKAI